MIPSIPMYLFKKKWRATIYKSFVCSAFFLLASYSVRPQSCANYSVSRATGITYNSISGTGSPFIWRNIISNQVDDNRSFSVPIGFDFWYLGTRYTQVNASSNGFIDFTGATYDGNATAGADAITCIGGVYSFRENPVAFSTSGCAASPPVSYSGTYLALAAMYTDLWASNGTAAMANSIQYITTGAAPNRVFTVEYVNMDDWATSAVSDYNFQIKLYETTGIIEYIYGTMFAAAGAAPNYACGINNSTMSATPTATELLVQQTANTATFSNAIKNNLTVAPASNSKLTFTPPAPTLAPTGLTFSGATKTSMTLNWSDNASNEVGYVIYNSTDNVTFSFASQVVAGSVSSAITGLLPSTTYYWQVYAVTDGNLGTALTGTQATLPAGTITSIASTSWNTTTTWSCTCIPTAGDNVIIADGTTVTLDVNGSCNSLTVGQGTSGQLTIGNDATARTLTVNTDVTVQAGATMTTGASAATHTMSVGGNLTNNGTLDLAPTGTRLCNIKFLKNGNQTLSGTGATTNFNRITLFMGTSNANVLDVTSTNFTTISTNFLDLVNGTFKLSTAANVTLSSAAASIPLSTGLWLNNAAATMSTVGGTISLFGYIKVTAGTANIGNAVNHNLTSYGGSLIINGGSMNIAGRYDSPGKPILSFFTMTSGTLTVATAGSTTAALAPFTINEPGSSFNISGGKIIIERSGAANLGFINTGGTSGTVSGGLLQIGNASTPAGQTMQINSSITVPNLLVNSTNSPTAQLSTNALTVLQNISISSGSTFNANNLNVTLAGNWINSGGTHTPGTNTTIFNNAGAQTITKSTGETFNNLTISGTGTKTLAGNISLNGNLNISSTLDVSATPYNVSLKGNWTNSGTFNQQTGTVTFNGTTAQQIIGSSTTTYYNLTLNNSSTATTSSTMGITLFIPIVVTNSLTLTNGRLHTSSTNILTMNAGSVATSGSLNSFIHGPMDKIGNTAFVFPIGDGTSIWWTWARIGIGTPTSSSTFRAQYREAPYANTTTMGAAPTPVLTDVDASEYWTLDRTAGTGDATVTLYWEAAALRSINDCSDLRIANWNGVEWINIDDAVTTTGTCSGLTPGTIATNNNITATSFSLSPNPFTFGSKLTGATNPLPIELLSFDAHITDKTLVNTIWVTATEINNDYFTLEKSIDGIHFENVAKIDGAGNSSQLLTYSYIDSMPFSGVSYYRLKQTDFDGKYQYSDLKTVNFINENEFYCSLFPNPSDGSSFYMKIVSNLSNVSTTNQTLYLHIYNTKGEDIFSKQLILAEDTKTQIIPLDLNNRLTKGVYFVSVITQQSIYKHKLIVN